jgi:putative spermidine/putrescine transport system permease protein
MKVEWNGPPAWLQALPLAAVFLFFFIAPLVLVAAVSLWPTSDYELLPGFSFDNYATILPAAPTWPSRALKTTGRRCAFRSRPGR